MKKMLFITHLSGKRVNRLWMSAITAAAEEGYQIHLACNKEQIEEPGWSNDCKRYGIIDHHIMFNRNPLSPDNIVAKKQLTELMRKEQFDFVHCNTPTGGLIGRISAAKAKVPFVIYQAHGFHFWKGAPLKNWLCYYPVERFLARYTDVLITINQEDFACAQKFKLKNRGKLVYVPGVGVDVEKISADYIDKATKRKSLGIPQNAVVFVSIGELNDNKNHITAIKAFAKANCENGHYLLCGVGNKQKELEKLTSTLKIRDKVHFLGFRADVIEILKISDVFVFPSLREGLSVSLMEAMATGVLCIASKIRGNTDLLPESKYLFDPKDEEMLTKLILNSYEGKYKKEEIQKNTETIKQFSMDTVVKEMKRIYKQA